MTRSTLQTKARLSGAYIGKLTIPRAKLVDLRRKIKVLVRKTPTGVPCPISSRA
jgi:hypothetical protein